MKLRFGIIFALLAYASVAQAQPLLGFPPGTFANKASLDPPAGGGGSFQGLGDVLPGTFSEFWSCGRTYTATYSGNVCDITNAAGTVGTRLIGTGSGGGITSLVSGSACTFVTGNACSSIATTCASTCYVVTMYTQAGGTNCVGSTACNAVQGTQANRPIYNSAFRNGRACLTPQGTSMQPLITPNITVPQPYTVSIVTQSPASGTTNGVWSGFALAIGIAWDSSTSWQVYSSTAQHVTGLSGSTWYAMQNVFDTSGAGSRVYVNGSSNSVSPGTVGLSSEGIVLLGDGFDTPTQPVCEWAIAPSNPGATSLGTATTNQRSSVSGYNF